MDAPSQVVAIYDQPHQFTPLRPVTGHAELVAIAREVVEKSLRLAGAIHPHTQGELRKLVRSMNSYYSNKLEGQSTHPLNIERALKKDFSATPDVAKRQRIAIAHIQAEQVLEGLVPTMAPRASPFLQRCHHELYERLQPEDRLTDEGVPIVPGAWRTQDVSVGQHVAPAHGAIEAFLAMADREYGPPMGLEAELITVACAHHRLAWVHPFLDGNGRAVRLQTHAALFGLSAGLWSVNRALARYSADYFRLLSEADASRQGDYDGRGNLSDRALFHWCQWFLQQCRDQVEFMAKVLDFDGIKDRLRALMILRREIHGHSEYRDCMVLPLLHTLVTGPLPRGEFAQMTGLGERVARACVSKMLEDGLLQSANHKAPLCIGFPMDMLATLFPNLYPEAASTPLEI